METAAAPVERQRPAPLAALGLALAIPATFIFADPITLFRWAVNDSGPTWLPGQPQIGLLFLAVGVTLIIRLGRGTLGVGRTVALATTTWLSLTVSALFLIALAFASAFGDCSSVSHPVTLPLVIVSGVAYVAVAYWALRRGKWWAVPLAVVGAVALCLLLAQVLPGVPSPYSPDSCYSD